MDAGPNPLVRRIVSEGTRLRLPWAERVAWLDAHPTRKPRPGRHAVDLVVNGVSFRAGAFEVVTAGG